MAACVFSNKFRMPVEIVDSEHNEHLTKPSPLQTLFCILGAYAFKWNSPHTQTSCVYTPVCLYFQIQECLLLPWIGAYNGDMRILDARGFLSTFLHPWGVFWCNVLFSQSRVTPESACGRKTSSLSKPAIKLLPGQSERWLTWSSLWSSSPLPPLMHHCCLKVASSPWKRCGRSPITVFYDPKKSALFFCGNKFQGKWVHTEPRYTQRKWSIWRRKGIPLNFVVDVWFCAAALYCTQYVQCVLVKETICDNRRPSPSSW